MMRGVWTVDTGYITAGNDSKFLYKIIPTDTSTDANIAYV